MKETIRVLIKVMFTMIYALMDRCWDRKSTADAAKKRRASHLRLELLIGPVAEVGPLAILNSGVPLISTGLPSLYCRGRIMNLSESLRFGLTPFPALYMSLIRVFWISRPAMVFSPLFPSNDLIRYHLGPRFMKVSSSVTLVRGETMRLLCEVSFWISSFAEMSSFIVGNWLDQALSESFTYL